MNELIPCPGCGRTDKLHVEGQFTHTVLCECGWAVIDNTRERAIERWNRRSKPMVWITSEGGAWATVPAIITLEDIGGDNYELHRSCGELVTKEEFIAMTRSAIRLLREK